MFDRQRFINSLAAFTNGFAEYHRDASFPTIKALDDSCEDEQVTCPNGDKRGEITMQTGIPGEGVNLRFYTFADGRVGMAVTFAARTDKSLNAVVDGLASAFAEMDQHLLVNPS